MTPPGWYWEKYKGEGAYADLIATVTVNFLSLSDRVNEIAEFGNIRVNKTRNALFKAQVNKTRNAPFKGTAKVT